jgi:hypothetical protein
MQSLHTRHRPVGLVNRGPAARGGKAAQNNDKQQDSRHFHNCGLSIPRCAALRSYQNQSSWQVLFDFFVQAIYFANVPVDKPFQNLFPALSASSAHWQTLESRCDASPDFDINHSRNRSLSSSPDQSDSCSAKKSRLRLHDIVSQGAHVSRDNRQPETVGIQDCAGCAASGWRHFAAKIASPTLEGVHMFPSHLSIRPDSPCHQLMEHGRPPPLDSAASPNFVRLKLPRACQSPVSRAVIDHNDLFLAPG